MIFRSASVFALVVTLSSCSNTTELTQKISQLDAALKTETERGNKCDAKNKRLTKSVQEKIRLQTENARLRAQLESLRADKKSDKELDVGAVEEAAKLIGITKEKKLYATFVTNKGRMVAELFWKRAPKTVTNFVLLAEGRKEWTDPRTGEKRRGVKLYNNTIFHRVIPKFMIQGGDPLGTGRGGPGYRFKDEFHPSLRHGSAGTLSMANSGPNSNGSQFYITEVATPNLDRKHSVFGRIIENVDLVGRIARVRKSVESAEKPDPAVVLKRVSIGRGKPIR